MTLPFVSSYDDAVRKAFDAFEFKDKEKIVTTLVDEIIEQVVDKARDEISSSLLADIQDDICRRAARIASSMLADALAGNDEQIRSLFGFDDYYLQHRFSDSRFPTQWNLIEAIAARRPDLFVDERIKQLEWKLGELEQRNAGLMIENNRLLDKLREKSK